MKTKQKLKMFSVAMLAIITFLVFAPVSVGLAAFLAIGTLCMPFIPMPSGIFGEGPAGLGADKEALLKEIKEKIAAGVAEFKSQLDIITAKNGELETKAASYLEKITKLEGKTVEIKELPEFKKLAEEVDAAILSLKALKEQGVKNEAKALSFASAFKKALEEKKEDIIKSMKDGKPYDLEVKLDAISEDNTILSGDTAISLTQNTGIISTIRKRILKYLQNVSTGTISTRIAMWIEEFGEDGQPLFVHEAIGKPQAIVKYVEKTEMVKKIAVTGKMSMEWMSDLPQLVNYVKNNLAKRLDIKTEDKLFNGAGGTGSDDPLGILVHASAFTGGSLAGKVTKPNVADVIRALVLQVEEAFGQANAVFVHPGVLAELDTIKSDDGLYTRPFWANGEMIAGIRVISTLTLAPGEFVGGDLSVMNVLFREGLNVRIGETGDDFKDNKKTIILEQRLVQFVSANDYAQIVKGNFHDASELLETVSS